LSFLFFFFFFCCFFGYNLHGKQNLKNTPINKVPSALIFQSFGSIFVKIGKYLHKTNVPNNIPPHTFGG